MELTEYYAKALLAQKEHKITDVFNIKELGCYEYSRENAKDLIKRLSIGKLEEIYNYSQPKDMTGKDMTLISFQIQGNYLFHALFYDSGELMQDPELLFVAKAFYYNISGKEQLLSEFKKIKSLNQKLSFWEEKIGIMYIDFIEDHSYYEQLWDFEVAGYNSKETWKDVNEWILENYSRYSKTVPIFLNLKELKKKFKENLSLTKNKEAFVYGEIRRIEKSFEKFTTTSLMFGGGGTIGYHNIEFNASYETYIDFYKYKTEPDLSIIQPRLDVLREVNGKTLAEYHLFVDSELLRIKKGKPSNDIEQDLTVQQKALLLYLSGFLDGMKGDNSNKARILAPLLSIGEKSLYDAILNVNSSAVRKDENNLKAILIFLEDQEEKSIKKLVSEELKKLNANN